MLTSKGHIYVMDFGLAKMGEARSALTQQGYILGTPLYMSPEQATGQPVDQRSDIYSVGVMFFAMLAGRLPNGPEKITSVRPDLPTECDTFYAKATAYNRDERFQDAHHVREALSLLYQTAKAEPTGPPVTAAPSLARRFLLAPLRAIRDALVRRRAR
jgi:serine/threonine-protein kinase